MRVDDRNLNGVTGAQANRTQEAERTGTGSGTNVSEPGTGDRAEISSVAGTISEALSAQSAARAQRMGQLAQQYSQGQYKPDTHGTSRGLIQDALGGTDGAR